MQSVLARYEAEKERSQLFRAILFEPGSCPLQLFHGFERMKKPLLAVLVVCVLFSVVLGYSLKEDVDNLYVSAASVSKKVAAAETRGIETGAQAGAVPFRSINLKLPAVDRSGAGQLADLSVELGRGQGKVFIRMDEGSPLLNPDTQKSIKIALNIARQIAQRDTSNVNVYYDISTSTSLVGGESAGAAMTVATIALLRNESLRSDTLVTGTVEADEKGTIGTVGGILGKAKAVAAAGYKRLLVPKGESVLSQYSRKTCSFIYANGEIQQNCQEESGGSRVADAAGIEVVEVADIFEAYNEMRA